MRKTFLTSLTMFILIGGMAAPTSQAQRREEFPKVRAALEALQHAKIDLEDAAHTFCGHRVEALEATKVAIDQLHLAIDTAMNTPPGKSSNLQQASYVQTTSVGEYEFHPNIHKAVIQLEEAKIDLQEAAHEFHGHRVQALESVNRALNQLKAAIACNRD